MTLGKQIKRLRTEKNITQEVLADYLGVSCQAVSKWENSVTMPDIGLLPDISIFFGIKIDDLFKLPSASHFERIENMIISEREISDENFKYAEGFLSDMIDKDSKDPRAYGNLAHLYNHRSMSLRALAGEYAKVALDLEPDKKSHHVALWDALQGLCGDEYFDNHFEIISYYKGFIEKNPDNSIALVTLIENLFADHRYGEAKAYMTRLKKIGKDYLYEMYLGDILLSEGKIEEALQHWDKGVKDNSHVWQAYCSRGDRLKKIGKIDAAILDYETCMEIQSSPRIVDGLLSLAQIYEDQKNYKKAIEAFERQLQIFEEDYNISSGEIIDKPKREINRLSRLI